MMPNRSSVAGRPKIRWLDIVPYHSDRIAEVSMPASI